jgi:HK97 gp10 family phage protein
MGKFDFQFDQELSRQLERLGNYDNIAPKILNGAVPILKRYVKAETAKHKRTGDMVESIKETTVSKNKYGWYVVVRPTGVDRNGVRNMEKMAHAEFGTSNQPPTPILTKALNDARDEVTDKMQEVFNEEVKNA